MICKKCGKNKPEYDFYLKGHTVNGKHYQNFSGKCKECISEEYYEKHKLTKVCSSCGKRLPINCFYENSKSNKCKKCVQVDNLLYYQTHKEERAESQRRHKEKIKEEERMLDEQIQLDLYGEIQKDFIEEVFIPEKKPDGVIDWVVRNLKNFGNCYIRRLNKIDIEATSLVVGHEISVRRTDKENDGYILEIRKGE